jgi:hypothetical protein
MEFTGSDWISSHQHKLALIPCSKKAGILRREKEESCQSFVLEQPLLLLDWYQTTSRVNDHKRADEARFQGEFNGVQGRRDSEQPSGTEHSMV